MGNIVAGHELISRVSKKQVYGNIFVYRFYFAHPKLMNIIKFHRYNITDNNK